MSVLKYKKKDRSYELSLLKMKQTDGTYETIGIEPAETHIITPPDTFIWPYNIYNFCIIVARMGPLGSPAHLSISNYGPATVNGVTRVFGAVYGPISIGNLSFGDPIVFTIPRGNFSETTFTCRIYPGFR